MENLTPESPIFIVGYMGCGKTTFGRALAKRLGRLFIDLDFYITQRFHRSVGEIFAERGEEGFRRLEREMLREAGEFSSTIVACGGGTPCFFDNMEYMNSRGLTVWLQASRERLLERLVRGSGRRPLLAGKSREEIGSLIDTMLETRSPFYGKAAIQFGGDLLESRSQIDGTLEKFLSLPHLAPLL